MTVRGLTYAGNIFFLYCDGRSTSSAEDGTEEQTQNAIEAQQNSSKILKAKKVEKVDAY
jgi:hypothetical protein